MTLVLVTRAELAGRELAEKVRAVGHEAIHCAPFALAGPAKPKQTAAQLSTLLPADRVIITSHEGIRRAVELVGAESFARSLVIVPGEGSVRLARELGIENVICPSGQGTSEAILELPELSDVEGLDILILAAEGGRGLMGQVLSKRGASVDRVHVYRRIDTKLPEGLDQQVAAAESVITLAASWEAVSGLAESLGQRALDRLKQGTLIAPSRRLAEKSGAIGFAHCVIAAGADDDSMLAKLKRLT